MEDRQIIALYWARCEQAIDETVAKYGAYCHTIAVNILVSTQDSEECLNDTWLAAWNSMPPHRPVYLSTFLGKLTRRAALKKYRDAHRQKRFGGEVPLALEELAECIGDPQSSPEAEALAAELRTVLNRFLASLPERERSMFLCRYWYLDSIDAIGAQFGCSTAAVKSQLHRTRKKLHQFLDKEGLL